MKTQNILLSILILLFSVSCKHSEEEVKLFNVDNINISINKSILDYYEELERVGQSMDYDNSHILDREGIKLYHIRGGNDSFTYIISLYFLNEKAKAIDIVLQFYTESNLNSLFLDKIKTEIQASKPFKQKDINFQFKRFKNNDSKFAEGCKILVVHKDIVSYGIKYR